MNYENQNRPSIKSLGATNIAVNKDREDLDFYCTPDMAVDSLMSHYEFEPVIIEPMAGEGCIAKKLASTNRLIIASDIAQRSYKLDFTCDYFSSNFMELAKKHLLGKKFSIITNPPYKLANNFIIHTLADVKPESLAVFLPLRYLEGQDRKKEIYDKFKPDKVILFSKRLGCYRWSQKSMATEYGVPSAVAYMWLVFNKKTMLDQSYETKLEWI
jgi:hypothetical protein